MNPVAIARPLPNPLYVVFCRVCGMDEKAADQLAADLCMLADVCKGITSHEGVFIGSSVYGRFFCVEQACLALDVAKSAMNDAAEQGVQLAIGVAAGKVERVSGLSGDNLVGTPINVAARLASLADCAGRIAVNRDVVQRAGDSEFRYRDAFEPFDSGQVKKTKLRYAYLQHQPPPLNTPPAPRTDGISEAHILVYDIVGYSQQTLDGQKASVDRLQDIIQECWSASGADARFRASPPLLWYAPAGDGGALVFSRHEDGGRAAWLFARELAARAYSKVDIRLGLETGGVVVLAGALPVGYGVLGADATSALAPVGQIAASTRFWQFTLTASDRHAWYAHKVEDKDAFILVPGNTRRVERPASLQRRNDSAQHVYSAIVSMAARILQQEDQLRDELEDALQADNPAAKDVVDLVLEGALDSVMVAINDLVLAGPRTDMPKLEALVNALAVLDVSPEWVTSTREAIKSGPARVQVATMTDKCSAERIRAAISGSATRWERQAHDSDPQGADYIDLSSHIEPMGTLAEDRMDELRRNIISARWGDAIDMEDPEADAKIAQRLSALARMRKPLYTMLSENHPLADTIPEDWRLLVLQQTCDAPKIQNAPHEISMFLREILNNIWSQSGDPR